MSMRAEAPGLPVCCCCGCCCGSAADCVIGCEVCGCDSEKEKLHPISDDTQPATQMRRQRRTNGQRTEESSAVQGCDEWASCH